MPKHTPNAPDELIRIVQPSIKIPNLVPEDEFKKPTPDDRRTPLLFITKRRP